MSELDAFPYRVEVWDPEDLRVDEEMTMTAMMASNHARNAAAQRTKRRRSGSSLSP